MEKPVIGMRVVHKMDYRKRRIFVVVAVKTDCTTRVWLHLSPLSFSEWVSLSEFLEDYVLEKESLEKVDWKKEGF